MGSYPIHQQLSMVFACSCQNVTYLMSENVKCFVRIFLELAHLKSSSIEMTNIQKIEKNKSYTNPSCKCKITKFEGSLTNEMYLIIILIT